MTTDFLSRELGYTDFREAEIVVRISAPERAALEFLQTLKPTSSDYEHADLIFEGLGTLRPELVQSLLEGCTSVKVKRLFLHLAEKHNHPWLKQVALAKVSLGSGKRVLVAGGRLDPKYLITVPAVAAVPATPHESEPILQTSRPARPGLTVCLLGNVLRSEGGHSDQFLCAQFLSQVGLLFPVNHAPMKMA